MSTDNNISLASIFTNNLRKDARTVSVATLLSGRYLRRINYAPYYQRNYVWEKDKRSFFIESIFLGTEIPPIVFYKKGTQVEVIDGRQRFETIKRFKEDDFSLHPSGLMELKALEGYKYSTLKPEFSQLFDDTKIRIFEFEIIGMPDLEPEIEDKVKKEIFRRYNSGITPLNQSEVDNAKYDDDDMTEYYKKRLKNDHEIYDLVKNCFFANKNKSQKELIVDMVTELRKLLVLDKIPISKYADSGKNLLIEMLYDKFVEELGENGVCVENIKEQLLDDIKTVRDIVKNGNNNVYECLIWAISVLRHNDVTFSLYEQAELISKHYISNYDKYDTDSDHYYGNIVARFQDTASFVSELYGFNYEPYMKNSAFSREIKDMQQTEENAELSMDKLSSLRISKPNPASKPIDQILREVESEKYLIRPSYQRQEKINVCKASSIIESIILGIKLPPLFIYVRNDGIREVIDGQQRLLSIIGFLGRKYKDEDGNLVPSINNCFKLKGLRILKDYNNHNYSDIIDKVEDTILDFDIDEIEIQEEVNPNFEPTDLFIRLNNKPYPIRANTFEMWNSVTDREVIERIKMITKTYSSWFYLKIPKVDDNGRSCDRMENEELVTILAYLCYNNSKTNDFRNVLGFYHRMKKFTCRLKNKSALTNVLDSFEEKPFEKARFLKSLDKTEEIINMIKNELLDGETTKESFNKILNVKNLTRFSRSYQEFYVLWEILMNVDPAKIIDFKAELISDIEMMFKLLKNVDEIEVEEKYVSNFIKKLNGVRGKYL